jgi:DNA replication ATP-dependent helicase Dna2
MDEHSWTLTLPVGADDTHPAFDSARSAIRSPAKRSQENTPAVSPSSKKLRTVRVEEGILKGRPILQDVVNGGK